MKRAMLGIVLEAEDFDILERIESRQDFDGHSIVARCLKALGAYRQVPAFSGHFPFIALQARLSLKGEEMLLECRRDPSAGRWFIGSDILKDGAWEEFKQALGMS